MGYTALARWTNAPTHGLDLIDKNIIRNHQGQYRGKWLLGIKSYRSTLGSVPGFQVHAERTMCALTMNDNVFVHLEDFAALTRADFAAQQVPESNTPPPTHYHHTFLTLNPPGALEQLTGQLKARWVPVRQTTASSSSQRSQVAQQLTIEGHIFAIGTDWLVRAGNVILAGGATKGMLLEAEYLPLTTLHTDGPDGTSELLSSLLVSVLPNVEGSKIVAVTVSDSQWEEVLCDPEEGDHENPKTKTEENLDDIYVYADQDTSSAPEKGEWVGVDRDRRSAFMIMGALRSEGIL